MPLPQSSKSFDIHCTQTTEQNKKKIQEQINLIIETKNFNTEYQKTLQKRIRQITSTQTHK